MGIKHFCFFAIMLYLNMMANAEPLGLVLSGGGAMGAYEVGVWQELQATGVASNVTAISGKVVTITETVQEPRKRWGFGVTAGYGAAIGADRSVTLSPFVGVGISYNFVNW